MVKNKLPKAQPTFCIFRTITPIKPVPEASEILKSALAECDICMTEIDPFKSSKRTKNGRTRSNRRLNGFMAFRIFYSRAAKDSASQTKLSSLLAKAWKEDPHKHVWSTYASLYNETGGNDPFIGWLQKALGDSNYINPKKRLVRKTSTKVFLNNIEDVFLS